MQELQRCNVDTHNVIVNQILYPEDDLPCKLCSSRIRIQKKYLEQVKKSFKSFVLRCLCQSNYRSNLNSLKLALVRYMV